MLQYIFYANLHGYIGSPMAVVYLVHGFTEYIAGIAVLFDVYKFPLTHKRPSASIFTCLWSSEVRNKHLESKLPRSFRCHVSSPGFWFWCGLFRDFGGQQKIPTPTQIFGIILNAVISFNSVSHIPHSNRPTLKHLS